MAHLDELGLSLVERRVAPLREISSKTEVLKGWIHYIRTSFGLTQEKLGELVGVGKAAVNAAEKREQEDKIQLETLRKFAQAMDCELIYAFVPKKNVEVLLKERAYEKAKKLIHKGNLHMELEGEKVDKHLEEQIRIVANDLLKSGNVW